MFLQAPPRSVSTPPRADSGTARAKAALRSLRDTETDPQVRQELDRVLEGALSLREFLRSDAAAAILACGLAELQRTWPTLSQEQRDLAEKAQSRPEPAIRRPAPWWHFTGRQLRSAS